MNKNGNFFLNKKFLPKIIDVESLNLKNDLINCEGSGAITLFLPYPVKNLKIVSKILADIEKPVEVTVYNDDIVLKKEQIGFTDGRKYKHVFSSNKSIEKVKISFCEINSAVDIKLLTICKVSKTALFFLNKYSTIMSFFRLLKNRNNINKFFHHLKHGNFKFIKEKINQKLEDDMGPEGVDYSSEPTNEATDYYHTDNGLFEEMFFRNNSKKDINYEPFKTHSAKNFDIKTIAFYLPQFHPIPENDKWWGKGFTEWTNVSKAIPQFKGHYQPRLPGELGFYDLRIKDVMRRQIDLAKNYGIHGFCFHFYWFNGKRILKKPFDMFLEDKGLNMPFCINWANENWTRRWDGDESEILLEQKYSDEDDIEFIKFVSNIFRDERYIRVDGKPLLIIYRPSLFPDIKKTANRWREYCRNNGIGEIFLALTHSFEHINPTTIGFDAAIDFPPNTFPVTPINDKLVFYNKNYNGLIFDYEEVIAMSKKFKKPSYKKFRGVCPSWDNEARKPGRGTSFINADPKKYEEWLSFLCDYTRRNFNSEERFIFINAWNEWAEGCYLEPDRYYGYGYLEASYNALSGKNNSEKKIVFVGHDAHFHGAQLLSLNIVKELKNRFGFQISFLLKSGGVLEEEYKKYAKVYNLEKFFPEKEDKINLIRKLRSKNFSTAISNTTVSGDIVPLLYAEGFKTINLIHELPNLIKRYRIEKNAELIAEYADKIVFPSNYVKEKFKTIADCEEKKAVVCPQGLYQINEYKNNIEDAKKMLRKQYKLPPDSYIVLGAGYADHRKGIDLFVEVANKTINQLNNVYFMWVGNIDVEMESKVRKSVKFKENVLFIPTQKEVGFYYAGADIYLLTSREDPFPSVVMEAMDVGVPVVGFKNAGGFADIVDEDTGILVPYEDVEQMSESLVGLLCNNDKRKDFAKSCMKLVEEKFIFKDYIYSLLDFLGMEYKKVSAVVPNYNYENYISRRLDSIANQSYPIYELIFLDDCSKDKSPEIATDFLEKSSLDYRIILNKENSGSVFKQWTKGINESKGDYIWIAEADDFCEYKFLEEVMRGFGYQDVILSYSQSFQIDTNGNLLENDYLEYTNDIDRKKWKENYFNLGKSELSEAFSIKNTIPNVSAVVFRKNDISVILEDLMSFKVAGDWFFYVWLLQQGNIYFVAESLNYHRRHDSSVTHSLNPQNHYDEVCWMQEYVKTIIDVDEATDLKIDNYRKYIKKYLQLV